MALNEDSSHVIDIQSPRSVRLSANTRYTVWRWENSARLKSRVESSYAGVLSVIIQNEAKFSFNATKSKFNSLLAIHSLAKNYVTETGVVALVDSLDPTICEATALVAAIAAMRPALLTVDFAINVTSKDSAAGLAWHKLHSKAVRAKKEAKILSGVFSHCEKQDFPNTRPHSIEDFIANNPGDRSPESFLHPHIVYCKHTSEIKQGKVLADTKCRPEADVVVDKDAGYYVVKPDESVIFLNKENKVKLVSLRGILHDTPTSKDLYEWLEAVIATACSEQRDVRPNHDGTMVQVGWNAGPHHVQTIAAVTDAVGETGLPKLATRNVAEGLRYRLLIGGILYEFPLYDRAPCEGLFTQNYASYLLGNPTPDARLIQTHCHVP
ncbi:hypothetical protein DFH08DRAFT_1052528 [Mycena albidolilacea]|uniref:Uncharacterized protein n=1 Tax=Mycena albidolilacea TaxID=1033008 RepID=A0AAD7AD12_9AGAR|nr:hypothetical protein DFH08DRAFT_1052528 [Mycena albidolilacea]